MSRHDIESFRVLELYHVPQVQFLAWEKPLKRFRFSIVAMITWLKPGADEMSILPRARRVAVHGSYCQLRQLPLLQKLIQTRHSLSIDLSPARQIVLQSNA